MGKQVFIKFLSSPRLEEQTKDYPPTYVLDIEYGSKKIQGGCVETETGLYIWPTSLPKYVKEEIKRDYKRKVKRGELKGLILYQRPLVRYLTACKRRIRLDDLRIEVQQFCRKMREKL